MIFLPSAASSGTKAVPGLSKTEQQSWGTWVITDSPNWKVLLWPQFPSQGPAFHLQWSLPHPAHRPLPAGEGETPVAPALNWSCHLISCPSIPSLTSHCDSLFNTCLSSRPPHQMPCAGYLSLGSGQGRLLEEEKGPPDGQRSLGPEGTRSLGCPHPAEGVPLAPYPRGLYIDYKYIRGKGVGGRGCGAGASLPLLPLPLVPVPGAVC